MKQNCLIVLTLVTATLADIGEKLRLGQSIKAVTQNNFNVGLQAPFSTNQNAVSLPQTTNYSDDEDNLDRLCNDPFHSFLCESVGPRKNKINGQLRPGAQIPTNVFTGASTNQNESKQKPFRTGVDLLAAVIQPSSSFDSSSVSAAISNRNQYLPPESTNQQSQPTQQFITRNVNPARPSNEYLPSNTQPVPVRKDNVQFSLPLEQQQQIIYRYSAPPSRPNTFISPSTKSPQFRQQTQFPITTTVAPIRQSSQPVRTTVKPITTPLFRPSTVRPIARPSNQYLPVVEPIDIRINPSSTNLSPLIQGNELLAAVRQPSSTEKQQPKKQERQHTLEELCNDAFHSFLCKPIIKPRKRIDGRIRPGAKIPPHVLQGADTFGSTTRKLAPQKEGTELLAQGRVAQNTPQGYFYPKPQNNPFLDTQATNQKPVENVLLKDNLPPIPKRIPPTGVTGVKAPVQNSFTKNQFVVPQTSTSRTTTQRPIQNFQFQAQTIKPQRIPTVFNDNLPPIPERIRPPASSNQNVFPTNQYRAQQIPVSRPTVQNKPIQNFQFQQNLFSTARIPSTTTRPLAFNSQFPTISTTTPRPNQFFQITQSPNRNNVQSKTQVGNYVFPKPLFPQNPIAAPAQISSQSQPFNTVNQVTNQYSNGYQYPKPSTPFTYPTTTVKPLTTLNLLYIPSVQNNFTTNLKTSQNQIITTNQRPLNLAAATSSYVYPKPSIAFTLPTVTTTPRYVAPTVTPPQQTAIPSNNRPIVTPSKPFSQNIATGYQYPKPVQPFTLPTTTAKSITQGGYTYPRPAKAFTLPPRNGLANTQSFGAKISFPTVQTFNQYSIPVNNVVNGDTISGDALPPSSQFEILKP